MDEMDTLADLGVALRPADGRASRLRERIGDDLATSAATRGGTVSPLAARRRRFRPAVLAVPVAAAAVAVVAASLAITNGPASSPAPSQAARAATGTASIASTGAATGTTVRTAPAAFTLVANADGSVTFTARDFVDTGAATRALRRAGLTGRVVNQQDPLGCQARSGTFTVNDLFPEGTFKIRYGNSVTMRSTDYPRGGGLFVAVLAQSAAHAGQGAAKVRVEILAFKRADRIPPCVDWLFAG
jgi:hypothetical protein